MGHRSVQDAHWNQEFIGFLDNIDRKTAEGQELRQIVDNYATHKHLKISAEHEYPSSASWLNGVEGLFYKVYDPPRMTR